MLNMLCLSALVGALFATTTLAHMQLHYPAPLNASNNPHRTSPADPYLQYPYDCCGPHDRWEYPCRGYLSLLGTPQGAPTATWEVGSVQTWNITGIGNHYGGSCQVGFSIDKGENFRVARSYEGNCPHRNGGLGPEGQDFYFFVPDDLETGVQVFAWNWYNREQEFNMNCAAVNITRPTSGPDYPPATTTTTTTCDDRPRHHPRNLHQHSHKHSSSTTQFVPFHERPLMFIADDGNECMTPKTTTELKYPDPGPDPFPGDGEYPLELPTGDCAGPGRQAYHGSTGDDGHV